MTSIHDFSARRIDGTPVELEQYRNQVVLIVNTASKCGFTPQYEGLQALHDRFGEQGFTVLGFPCDQFAHQEPGSEARIEAFCQSRYGVTFPLFEKIDVNGDQAHPLFRFLKDAAPGVLGSRAIKWNFTKFLIDGDGRVVRRYGSRDRPESLAGDIQALL